MTATIVSYVAAFSPTWSNSWRRLRLVSIFQGHHVGGATTAPYAPAPAPSAALLGVDRLEVGLVHAPSTAAHPTATDPLAGKVPCSEKIDTPSTVKGQLALEEGVEAAEHAPLDGAGACLCAREGEREKYVWSLVLQRSR